MIDHLHAFPLYEHILTRPYPTVFSCTPCSHLPLALTHPCHRYVGYSRNMDLAVTARLARAGPARCAFVRTMVFANSAMVRRPLRTKHIWSGIPFIRHGPPKELLGSGPLTSHAP